MNRLITPAGIQYSAERQPDGSTRVSVYDRDGEICAWGDVRATRNGWDSLIGGFGFDSLDAVADSMGWAVK